MNSSILDAAVVSKLPPGKTQLSKLKEMEETRKIAREKNARSLTSKSDQTADNNGKIPLLLLHSDAAARNSIRSIGKTCGYSTYSVSSFGQAMRTFDIRDDFGVIVVGLSDKPDSCEERLIQLQQRYPNVSVIGLAAKDKPEWVVDLVSRGLLFLAISEPLNTSEYQKAIVSAYKRHSMLNKMQDLRDNVEADSTSISKLRGLIKKSA